MTDRTLLRLLVAASLGFGVAACGDDGDGGSEPQVVDTDNDLVSDEDEIAIGSNPNNADENSNFQLDGLDDADGDGLPLWAEVALGLDPEDEDSDGDGVLDGYEDTDGDGALNIAEAWKGDSSGSDEPDNSWDPAEATPDAYQCDVPEGTEGPAYFADSAYRFTQISISSPGALGTLLGGLIRTDIGSGELNILVPTTSFDAADCVARFQLSAGAGTAIEGEGEEDPTYFITNPEQVVFTDAIVIATSDNTAYFSTTLPLSIVFPAILPGGGTIDIPLRHIQASGTITEDEQGNVSLIARLSGAILAEDAEDLNFSLSAGGPEQNLGEVLSTTPTRDRFFSLDYDVTSEEPEELGYRITATISADAVTLVDAPEPGPTGL